METRTARMMLLVQILVIAFASMSACGQDPIQQSAGEFAPNLTVPAAGPLRVLASNPRYFTDGSGKAIYLTGSHTWANLQDGLLTSGVNADPPPAFDYIGYLDFLQRRNHNFMRLWSASELPKTDYKADFGTGAYYPAPSAWARTGPGIAADGKPKFDLDQFNQAYFDRLRSRVIQARDRNIYVSIMFFDGWPVNWHPGAKGWNFSPFDANNNVNGINGDPNKDGHGYESHSLADPAIVSRQEAYIRKVIDTVNDLDNVLYEISNEESGGVAARDWQYHLINYVKRYQAGKPKQHPVGMTAAFDFTKGSPAEWLFESPADWISPGLAPWDTNPPAATGLKVILSDTDHIFGIGGNSVWVWKTFTRGHNPIYMDPYGAPGFPSADESARNAMGHTRHYATRMNLASISPRGDLASTGYALANPGWEYLVYQPESGAFTVNLVAGAYIYEWFNPTTGVVAETGAMSAPADKVSFKAPFNGHAVLYLKSAAAPSIPAAAPSTPAAAPSTPAAAPNIPAAAPSKQSAVENTTNSTVPTAGPLRVLESNSRYFADGSGKAIYLTGSHTWANLQDGLLTSGVNADPPPAFDYAGYLAFLQRRNHNFMRLWSASELPKTDYKADFGTGIYYPTPSAWARPGLGIAADGKPKFDLDQFNQAYFDRLRSRVIQARDRNIYVSIMLFDGWPVNWHPGAKGWNYSPFHPSNNVNGINGDPNGDGYGYESHSLANPAIVSRQEAYVRKVIDTVNDLDNVLYEISNEESGGVAARDWQYHLIKYIKTYQAGKPKQHPVGMTAAFDFTKGSPAEWLFESPADWISPGLAPWDTNPPAATGDKVILADTDHIFGIGGDSAWVWKTFTRGHNPIYTDPYGAPGFPAADESARNAMGHTRHYATKMDLASMRPRGDLASTGYTLANPGREYLVYQPESGAFTVNPMAGVYIYEWFNPATGAVVETGAMSAPANRISFKAPFNGHAVLYLKSAAAPILPAAAPILPLPDTQL